MTRRVQTEPEASSELLEAALWYEEQRHGLGAEFLAAVDAALEFIARFAKAGEPVPEVPEEIQARRVPVRRFPFYVIYLEFPEVIRVLAVAHYRRSPDHWRSRT